MNKKASATGWILGIIGIIIIVITVFVGVYISDRDKTPNQDEEDSGIMQLFLKAEDGSRGEYRIKLLDNTTKSGTLSKDAYIPITIGMARSVEIMCWSEDSYTTTTHKAFTMPEIQANKSKAECKIDNHGTIDINFIRGDLLSKNNDLHLNLTAVDGSFKKLGICFSWTAGIIEAKLESDIVTCKEGVWKNNSLPPETYLCGTDQYQICKSVQFNRCTLKDMVDPERFENKVDSCVHTGVDLQEGEQAEIKVKIKTIDNKNDMDFVELIFFDHDRRFIPALNDWMYVSELGGVNLGADDYKFRLNYGDVK